MRRNGWNKVRIALVGGVLVTAVPIAGGGVAGQAQTSTSGTKQAKKSASGKSSAKGKTPGSKTKAASSGKTSSGKTAKGKGGRKTKTVSRKPTAQTIRLTKAFVATEQLRPMAQQLASTRSVAAYSGVEGYARQHPGEGAAAAYLALGHAYMLDRRFADAESTYRRASVSGTALDDYADYLGAQAAVQAGRGNEAYALLDHFGERHPESIFVANAPVLLANAYLQQNDPQGALRILTPLAESAQASHADFRYALGRAYQMSGDTTQAGVAFRRLYVALPLSPEAAQARTQLQAMGVALSAAEQKVHADQLFNAKRYAEAGEEYHAIERNGAGLNQADHNALLIYAAACDIRRLKRLSRKEAEKLPETSDDSAALKMYLLAEISRSEKDESKHDALIAQMVQRFPHSRWLEEALYSGGNMYLLQHDTKQATYHYSLLVKMFPNSTYAASAHWRAAWMNYRERNYTEAARLMDEQIEGYAGGIEVPSALYWRGRIYEEQEHNFAQAMNYYRVLASSYINFYYAGLARQRLNVLKGQTGSLAPAAVLSAVRKPEVPFLTGELPENEPHLIKARLLANASLNEYIGPEIQASPTANEWALAQAEIFVSYGEYTRSLQSMKRSGISFFSMPIDEVPTIYWKLLFPQPYWGDLEANAQRNGLDPYLVASLIRQESEFNAGVVSHANAWGLMQLLPSVGKSVAKKQGVKGFNTNMLLNPSTNLQLGTVNLRQVMDRFGGQIEYALAAYNAGDTPVRRWMSDGDYKDIAEFVESIPYTETREYVQAILRNREIYRALYGGR